MALERFVSPAFIRTLRIITIFTFPPFFPLLLAHGLTSKDLCPVLGLIPLGISSLFGIFQLCITGKRRDGKERSNHTAARTVLTIAADTLLSLGFLAVLIVSWIMLSAHNNYWRHRGSAVLGTYATIGLMINWIIHMYLVVIAIFTSMIHALRCRTCEAVCPNCSHNLQWQATDASTGNVEYSALGGKATGFSYAEGEDEERNVGELSMRSSEETVRHSEETTAEGAPLLRGS